MRDRTRHPHDRLALDWFASLKIKLACDAAHGSMNETSARLEFVISLQLIEHFGFEIIGSGLLS